MLVLTSKKPVEWVRSLEVLLFDWFTDRKVSTDNLHRITELMLRLESLNLSQIKDIEYCRWKTLRHLYTYLDLERFTEAKNFIKMCSAVKSQSLFPYRRINGWKKHPRSDLFRRISSRWLQRRKRKSFVAVGYKDRGHRRDVARDGSPSWQEAYLQGTDRNNDYETLTEKYRTQFQNNVAKFNREILIKTFKSQ